VNSIPLGFNSQNCRDVLSIFLENNFFDQNPICAPIPISKGFNTERLLAQYNSGLRRKKQGLQPTIPKGLKALVDIGPR
jgi:hypothetical protein